MRLVYRAIVKRSPFILPLAAWFTALFAIAAFGDDGQDALKKAVQAQLAAPAWRMTMRAVDHTENSTTDVVVEFVSPASIHSSTTVDGKLTTEIVSDGQKTFMRHGDGDFRPAPANTSDMLVNARKAASVERIGEMAAGVKFLDHEDVNGVRASVYTFDTDAMGLTGTTKLWISDKDNLPLKAEGHSEGVLKTGAVPGRKVDRSSTMTFDYDPSLKITLPGS